MTEIQSTPEQPHRVEFELYDAGFEAVMSSLIQHAERESVRSDARLMSATSSIRALWRTGNEGLAIAALLDILACEFRRGGAR